MAKRLSGVAGYSLERLNSSERERGKSVPVFRAFVSSSKNRFDLESILPQAGSEAGGRVFPDDKPVECRGTAGRNDLIFDLFFRTVRNDRHDFVILPFACRAPGRCCAQRRGEFEGASYAREALKPSEM